MKIKITNCSNPHWWYVNKINEVIEVQEKFRNNYIITDNNSNWKKAIDSRDAVEI